MSDKSYVDGLEQGIEIVKAILSLDVDTRKAKFGSSDIATILDRFDFAQLNEMVEAKEEKELKQYYVIRGIRQDPYKKVVVFESPKLKYEPDKEMIEKYLNFDTADFVVVEAIYVMEKKVAE